jgi:hypothetical protein
MEDAPRRVEDEAALCRMDDEAALRRQAAAPRGGRSSAVALLRRGGGDTVWGGGDDRPLLRRRSGLDLVGDGVAAPAVSSREGSVGSTRGEPGVDRGATLLQLFCTGLIRFDPFANPRCGSASEAVRTEPLARIDAPPSCMTE